MKRFIWIALTWFIGFHTLSYAEDFSFRNCRVADAKGEQTKAALIFSDSSKDVVIQVSGHDWLSIPYTSLDKVSYEYSRKHRITTGAILMALTPFGAGGLVMLTKAKSNWLYIDFHDKDGNGTVVLKLQKKDLPGIFDAFKTHAGREVVNAGDAGKA